MALNQTKTQIMAIVVSLGLIFISALTMSNQAKAGSSFNAFLSTGSSGISLSNSGLTLHFGAGLDPWGNYSQPAYNHGHYNFGNHGQQPGRKRYVVTGGSYRGFVPLRAKPGRGTAKLAHIPHYSKRVFGQGKKIRRHGSYWSRVRYNGQIGWVKSSYLKRIH